MIDAILWDFGGVLTTSPFEAFNRYEREQRLPLDFIRGVNARNAEHNAWARFESSAIDLDTFDRLFAEESEALGYRVPGREVVALLSGDIRPRMVEVLRTCKRHFRVGCITNNVKSGQGPGMATDGARAGRVAEVMGLFDLVVESSLEGIRKPDPRIYRIACERLAVTPERTVFLDDLGVNLKPARALGMYTIKVLGEEQAIGELARITGLELP
jgi:putative hydrolase of the HAD superfamily